MVDQGRLYLLVAGERYELRHIGSCRFDMLRAPSEVSISFDVVASEPARSFRFQGVQGDFTVVRVTETGVTAAALQEFAGRYFSEELQGTTEIAAMGGGIGVRGPGIESQVFPMAAPDEFRSDVSIQFTRGPGGSITGFALSDSRSRNMRSDRVVSPR